MCPAPTAASIPSTAPSLDSDTTNVSTSDKTDPSSTLGADPSNSNSDPNSHDAQISKGAAQAATTESKRVESTAAASRLDPTAAARAAQLARTREQLAAALRPFPDFPAPGVLFRDIFPIFAQPALHAALLHALELLVQTVVTDGAPDVVVGLDARGFLFGPSLALRLGAAFVPVRKRGKLPGPTLKAEYAKEYGLDVFEMQEGAIAPGQRVLIVDDIVATGGSCLEQSLFRQCCR